MADNWLKLTKICLFDIRRRLKNYCNGPFGLWIVAGESYYDTRWNLSHEFHLHFSPFLVPGNARKSVPTINHCSREAAFYICPREAQHHYHINCIFHDVILRRSNIQDGLLIQSRALRHESTISPPHWVAEQTDCHFLNLQNITSFSCILAPRMFHLRASSVMQVRHAECHERVWQFDWRLTWLSPFACFEHFIAHADSSSRNGDVMQTRVKRSFCMKPSVASRFMTMALQNANHFIKKSFKYPFQTWQVVIPIEKICLEVQPDTSVTGPHSPLK